MNHTPLIIIYQKLGCLLCKSETFNHAVLRSDRAEAETISKDIAIWISQEIRHFSLTQELPLYFQKSYLDVLSQLKNRPLTYLDIGFSQIIIANWQDTITTLMYLIADYLNFYHF